MTACSLLAVSFLIGHAVSCWQDDAMGFALGAATGNRSGSIDGPGWTLLDPAAAPVADHFSPGGPLLSNSPRRTLRVEFTCNKCWERTTRAINPQAYKTGTVFVQVTSAHFFAAQLLLCSIALPDRTFSSKEHQ